MKVNGNKVTAVKGTKIAYKVKKSGFRNLVGSFTTGDENTTVTAPSLNAFDSTYVDEHTLAYYTFENGLNSETPEYIDSSLSTAIISTDNKKFGTSSARICNDNGKAIILQSEWGDLDLFGSDFTVDFWIYCNGFSTMYQKPFALFATKEDLDNDRPLIELSLNTAKYASYHKLVFTGLFTDATHEILCTDELTNMEPTHWNHIALVYDKASRNFMAFANGVKVLTRFIDYTDLSFLSGAKLLAMRDFGYMGYPYFVDELRISKSVRYTSNFDVPNVSYLENVNGTQNTPEEPEQGDSEETIKTQTAKVTFITSGDLTEGIDCPNGYTLTVNPTVGSGTKTVTDDGGNSIKFITTTDPFDVQLQSKGGKDFEVEKIEFKGYTAGASYTLNLSGLDVSNTEKFSESISIAAGNIKKGIITDFSYNPNIGKSNKVTFRFTTVNSFYFANIVITIKGASTGSEEQQPEEPTTVTLTINPTPADATVEFLTNIGDTFGNQKVVSLGTEVPFRVSKDGYETHEETVVMTEDKTINVELVKIETPTEGDSDTQAGTYTWDGTCTYAGTSEYDVASAEDANVKMTLSKGTGSTNPTMILNSIRLYKLNTAKIPVFNVGDKITLTAIASPNYTIGNDSVLELVKEYSVTSADVSNGYALITIGTENSRFSSIVLTTSGKQTEGSEENPEQPEQSGTTILLSNFESDDLSFGNVTVAESVKPFQILSDLPKFGSSYLSCDNYNSSASSYANEIVYNIPQNQLGRDWTLGFWCKVGSANAHTGNYVLSLTDNDGGVVSFRLRTQNNNAQMFLDYCFATGGTATFNSNDWNHIAITYTNEAISMFVNGVKVFTYTIASLFRNTRTYSAKFYADSYQIASFDAIEWKTGVKYIDNFDVPTTAPESDGVFTATGESSDSVTTRTISFSSEYDTTIPNNIVTTNSYITPDKLSTIEYTGTDEENNYTFNGWLCNGQLVDGILLLAGSSIELQASWTVTPKGGDSDSSYVLYRAANNGQYYAVKCSLSDVQDYKSNLDVYSVNVTTKIDEGGYEVVDNCEILNKIFTTTEILEVNGYDFHCNSTAYDGYSWWYFYFVKELGNSASDTPTVPEEPTTGNYVYGSESDYFWLTEDNYEEANHVVDSVITGTWNTTYSNPTYSDKNGAITLLKTGGFATVYYENGISKLEIFGIRSGSWNLVFEGSNDNSNYTEISTYTNKSGAYDVVITPITSYKYIKITNNATGSTFIQGFKLASNNAETNPQPTQYAPLWIRGSFIDWEISDDYKMSTTDGRYYTFNNLVIPANSQFKIGDEGWVSSIGSYETMTVEGDCVVPVINAAFSYNLSTPNRSMTIGTLTYDNYNNTLTLSNVQLGEIVDSFTEFYLRGSFNEWGYAEDKKLTTTDGNIYVINNVSLTGGTEFKIATSDWGASYGTYEIVNSSGTYYTSETNCIMGHDMTFASITLNRSEYTITFVEAETITEPENPGEEEPTSSLNPGTYTWSGASAVFSGTEPTFEVPSVESANVKMVVNKNTATTQPAVVGELMRFYYGNTVEIPVSSTLDSIVINAYSASYAVYTIGKTNVSYETPYTYTPTPSDVSDGKVILSFNKSARFTYIKLTVAGESSDNNNETGDDTGDTSSAAYTFTIKESSGKYLYYVNEYGYTQSTFTGYVKLLPTGATPDTVVTIYCDQECTQVAFTTSTLTKHAVLGWNESTSTYSVKNYENDSYPDQIGGNYTGSFSQQVTEL